MSEDGGCGDAALYRELVRPVASHPDWVRTEDSATVDTAVTEAVQQGLGELFYRYQSTAARLHIRLPDQRSSGALDALLDCPLDPVVTEMGPPDSFTAVLGRAHRQIAAVYGTRYTAAVADPRLILTVSVPVAYEDGVWQDTVAAVSTVAETVDGLHAAVTRSVRAFDAEQC